MDGLLQIIIGVLIILGIIISILLINIHKALIWNQRMISEMHNFLREKFDYDIINRLEAIENILDDIKEHRSSEDPEDEST